MGLKTMEGDVTVKTADAEFELASVAFTVWAPAKAPPGTTNVHEKEPAVVVVTVAGVVGTTVPSHFSVMVDEEPKDEPVTVTVVPSGPELGLKVIAGIEFGDGGGG